MTTVSPETRERWHQGRCRLDLPESADGLLEQLHLPFVESLKQWHQQKGSTVIVGLQGCQGAGKSTLCELVPDLAHDLHGLRVGIVALDDFYLPLAQREQLSHQHHPLWITRGVPGTHESELAAEVLDQLATGDGDAVTVPSFDKGIDDRLETSHTMEGSYDVVIFEGWCVGLGPCSDHDWETPINELEQQEDAEMLWRQRIRDELEGPYLQLFARFDHLAILLVPAWQTVSLWRGQQEEKLRQDRGDTATRSMDDAALKRFLDHYERLTRWTIETLPARADFMARIAEDRSVIAIETGQEN
ncbi:MAG: kinase [Planctomycetota bacterium]|nr:kinase [Planctomycetota bacterium]